MVTRFERVSSTLLTGAAVVMALAIAHREFTTTESSLGQQSAIAAIEYDSTWRSILPYALPEADTGNGLKIIEFADFECPVCRTFQVGALRETRARYANRLDVWFVHFPIRRHRFARPAAEASECAERQNRFGSFVDAAFAQQDSFGLKPWTSIGVAAGIPDTMAFVACLKNPVFFSRIDSGLALALRKSLLGTPTVYVNGWRFSRPPTSKELSSLLDDILAGRKRAD